MLQRIAECFGNAAWSAGRSQDFRPVRHRPESQQRLNARYRACPGSVVRHQRQIAEAERLPVSFVIAEDEGFVSYDRAASRTAKHIAFEMRNVTVVEEISRIKDAVAQKFVDRPMKRVRAVGGDDVDLCARPFAIFRAIGVGDDGKFTDRVNAQQLAACASRRVVDLGSACVFHSIQQKKILLWPAPGDGKHISDHGI